MKQNVEYKETVEFSLQETALLAYLNDYQSLKKRDTVVCLSDPAFVHNIFTNIFKNHSDVYIDYPEVIKSVIKKVVIARENCLLDHYIDIVKRYRQKNIRIVRVTDSEYPSKLMKIPDPPFVLYLKGRVESLSRPAVAIVGTRDISPEGTEKVQEIVGFFVQLGYTIVSGLALGTDACAHRLHWILVVKLSRYFLEILRILFPERTRNSPREFLDREHSLARLPHSQKCTKAGI